jgi:hypothetical protein
MTSDVKLRGEGEEGKGDRYGEGKFVRGRVGRKNFVCVCWCVFVLLLTFFCAKMTIYYFFPKKVLININMV